MKTKVNMNLSELFDFNRDIVSYINDNLTFIKELAESKEAEVLAKSSLDHYNATVEASGKDEERFSDEQRDHFLATAKLLFQQGFVQHAGYLNMAPGF